MLNIQSFARKLLVALALVAGAGAAQAGPLYHVDLDTHAWLGTSGFLDLYLNREMDAPAATVTLTNFSGALTQAPGGVAEFAAVIGHLPGTLVFGTDYGYSDYFQSVDFGGIFSFDLQFDGDFATTDSEIASRFGVGLYDAGQQQLGVGDFLALTLVPQVGGVPGGVVPEPSDLALMVTGLAMLGLVRRRRAVR